jgi:hypothetical protein
MLVLPLLLALPGAVSQSAVAATRARLFKPPVTQVREPLVSSPPALGTRARVRRRELAAHRFT